MEKCPREDPFRRCNLVQPSKVCGDQNFVWSSHDQGSYSFSSAGTLVLSLEIERLGDSKGVVSFEESFFASHPVISSSKDRNQVLCA